MPVFTFEIVRHGEAPVIADVLRLPDERAMWCRVEAWLSDERAVWCRAEALALRIENTARLFESKIPRARPSFEPASPLRSFRLKSVHAWPAPSKES
jgi:hypothetical protein